jgi:hypothetical protein
MDDKPAAYILADDEKSAQVMIYTPTSLFWGEVVLKTIIRVSTWLRTNSVPDWISLYNAGSIITTSGTAPRTMHFVEMAVPVQQIIGYHLLPPAVDALDYDPSEPNRRMEPVNALIGTFQVKGLLRINASATLKRFLEVTRENYTPLYDAEITNLILPAFGPVKVPYILIRQVAANFTTR